MIIGPRSPSNGYVDCWLLLRPTNRHRETETSFWFSFKWKYWLSLARPGTGPPPLTARSSGSNLWQFEFHQKQMLEIFSSISFSKHCLLIHHRSIFISNPLQKIHPCQKHPPLPPETRELFRQSQGLSDEGRPDTFSRPQLFIWQEKMMIYLPHSSAWTLNVHWNQNSETEWSRAQCLRITSSILLSYD